MKHRLIKAANFIKDQWNHVYKKNEIEMYSTHNEWKSVVAERFIRTLKNKIYKCMTSLSNDVYTDDEGNKYNNTYHIKIRYVISDPNPIQDGGQKSPPPPFLYPVGTIFSPVTSINVGISAQNFLTFNFNTFGTLV